MGIDYSVFSMKPDFSIFLLLPFIVFSALDLPKNLFFEVFYLKRRWIYAV